MARKSKLIRTPKSVDEKYFGPEPGMIEDVRENDPRLSAAYNWYNYFYDVSTGKKWVLEYMKRHSAFTKADIEYVRAAEDWRMPMTACSIAKLSLNGTKMPARTIEFLHERINRSIEAGKKKEPVAETAPTKTTIQYRMRERTSAIIADVEDEIDKFINAKYTGSFSFYEYCVKKEVIAQYANKVKEYYSRLKLELELVSAKKDKDLVEGYKNLSKQQINNYLNFVTTIYNDADRFAGNKKKARLPRKKKQKSTTDLVKSLRFKKEDNELKITSVNPSTIIGAKSLWVYNTKYKLIGVYNASSDRGLGVKGSSITQFDAVSSMSKTARKPEEIIQKVLKAGVGELKKMMSSLSTKEKMMNGRINTETILLRVIK